MCQFTGTDWAKIGLPLQIIGFVAMIIGAIYRDWLITDLGLAAHFIGDVFFFAQMRKQGCL